MFRATLLAAAAISVFAIGAASAEDSWRCGSRDKILASLEEKFDETRYARGLSSDGELIEITTSPEGTWSILITRPGGPTCFGAIGDGWEILFLVGQQS